MFGSAEVRVFWHALAWLRILDFWLDHGSDHMTDPLLLLVDNLHRCSEMASSQELADDMYWTHRIVRNQAEPNPAVTLEPHPSTYLADE